MKKITVITEDDPVAAVTSVRYFADGLPGLMFHDTTHDILLNNGERKLSSLFLYGQTVRPIQISTTGACNAIIFHFYPHGIKLLFGIDANELTDTCIDHKLLPFKDTAEVRNRLLDVAGMDDRIKILSDAIKDLFYNVNKFLKPEIQIAVERITDTCGNVALRDLQNDLNITERTFERKFLQYVGVTPALFRRICKFYNSLEQMESNHFNNLTELSYDQGFADQSHFIRTFRQFTGFSPRQYLLNFSHNNDRHQQ